MPLFDELLVFRDADPSSAAVNMAIDEALLEFSSVPSVRFYQWQRPSLSFGYFGRFSDVSEFRGERDLVRRWTGGGIVLHGQDLTYSIILPAQNRAELPDSKIIYRDVHRALRKALVASGIPASLTGVASPLGSASCFATPVAADVMLDGHKIAGAAHRRSKLGLLHQGSIQNVALPPDYAGRFAAELAASLQPQALGPELYRRAGELARDKYARKEWLERR